LKPPFCDPSDPTGTCGPRPGDAFVYDRITGTYEPMPLPNVDRDRIPIRGTAPSMSGDGRWVTYLMDESFSLDPFDDSVRSVWVHDRQTGATEPVNVRPDGGVAVASGSPPDISDDGRFLAFGGDPGDWGLDPAFPSDRGSYVRDLVDGRTTLVARNSSIFCGSGVSISDDGRYVALDSSCADLVPDDTNGVRDIFVRAYPTPVVRSIDPAMVPRGASTKITVTGDGFAPSPNVTVSGAGVVVASVKRVTDHELRVSVIVDPGATSGARSVIVTNTGTGPGPTAGDTGGCSSCLVIT
jgi:IPT/TIG domain